MDEGGVAFDRVKREARFLRSISNQVAALATIHYYFPSERLLLSRDGTH